jgi:hypothetical protein
VKRAQGITRAQLWENIVEQHFMQFREAEFRQAAQVLVRDGVLRCDPPARNGRLNDGTTLLITVRRTPEKLRRQAAIRRSS